MLISKLSDSASIEALDTRFAVVLKWLRENAATIHASGQTHVDIIPGEVWANVETPCMKHIDKQVLELHEDYIDVHVPVDRDEIIGYKPAMLLGEPTVSRDAARDIAFYDERPLAYVTLHPGEFAIMWPHDAHAPIIGDGGTIKKICVKIAYRK